jgi:hypothetical protein
VVLRVVTMEKILINISDRTDVFYASKKSFYFTIMPFVLCEVILYFVSLVFQKVLGPHTSFTMKMDSDMCGSFTGPN